MPIEVCKPGQLGPFQVWDSENSVESFNPATRRYVTKDVCLDATYKEMASDRGKFGIIKTKHFAVRGMPLDPGKWSYRWHSGNPAATDQRFDLLQTAYTLEKYFERLDKLKVFLPGLDNVLIKDKIRVDVSTQVYPNAFFIPQSYGLFLGMILYLCNFGSDKDILIHELTHLLTFTTNRVLGRTMDDIEGPAQNESMSDIIAALEHLDAEIAESITVCLKKSDILSPQIGLRTVSQPQLALFHDAESHRRTSQYTPFLWDVFTELAKVLNQKQMYARSEKARGKLAKNIGVRQAALEDARDIMQILVHNMPAFLPARPTKTDFVRALVNALNDFKKRGDLKAHQFDKRTFLNVVMGEAHLRKLITTNKERKHAFSYFPVVKNPNQIVNSSTGPRDRFAVIFPKGRIRFYQHKKNGMKVEGSGFRFIQTPDKRGWYMVDMLWRPKKQPAALKKIDPQQAWQRVVSKNTYSDIINILNPHISNGTIMPHEKDLILEGWNKARNTTVAASEVVYIPGSPNIWYKFDIENVGIIYVDSVNGGIKMGRDEIF